MPTVLTMCGMTELDQRERKWMGRLLMLSFPLIVVATVFVELYVTFLVTRSFAVDMLGEIAARPAAFAGLIALVATPMHVAWVAAYARRGLEALWTGAVLPTGPVRTRWDRFAGYLVEALLNGCAALIVFQVIADPGAASLGPLLAVTVLGPVAVFWLARGLGLLRRWGWRRWKHRGHQLQHLGRGLREWPYPEALERWNDAAMPAAPNPHESRTSTRRPVGVHVERDGFDYLSAIVLFDSGERAVVPISGVAVTTVLQRLRDLDVPADVLLCELDSLGLGSDIREDIHRRSEADMADWRRADQRHREELKRRFRQQRNSQVSEPSETDQ